MSRFPTLTHKDVEARIGTCSEKGVSLLLYKDARCDMRILDETVGAENWQCEYYERKGTLFCKVGIFTDFERGPMWVWKADAGSPSNMEAQKGEASDAFKRACFRWGIGRELYTAPFVWVPHEKLARHQQGNGGKWQCWDRFSVTWLQVENGAITGLEIVDDTSHQVAFAFGKKAQDDDWRKLLIKDVMGLKADAAAAGADVKRLQDDVAARFGDRPLNKMSRDELSELRDMLSEVVRGLNG